MKKVENNNINNAIEVRNLKILYRSMKSFSIKKSMKNLFNLKRDSFEALQGISFDIEKGRIVGIVGQNGSGKSTLLKSIAGVFSPDEGSINTFNQTISLLSIGVGFQSKLSGYENIFLSGLLLGFSEQEIKNKISEIIEFSELRDFIYKPVRTYSSGMHSKLAFSITAILETDIMLIDEVLSVGDINFKEKSYNRMKEIISDKDRTVVIVSHSMNTLRELCDDVIWIEKGLVKDYGNADTIIKKYVKFMRNLREEKAKDEK